MVNLLSFLSKNKGKTVLSLTAAFLCMALLLSCQANSNPDPNDKTTFYTVSFDTDGGNPQTISDINVDKGKSMDDQYPANPSKEGYVFDGWYSGDNKSYTKTTAINGNISLKVKWTVTSLEDQPDDQVIADLFNTDNGFPNSLSNSWKIWEHRNPVLTQGFGADPTAMVYNDRVYLYMSNDTLLYGSGGTSILNNGDNYGSGIQGFRVLSSADLSNWTDHGVMNFVGITSTNPLYPTPEKLITFASATWAPSAVWKMVDGKPKFFLYWCNSGNGVGVVTADSPTGPWTSPLNKLMIDRNTPNCSDVIWLFDPGAFIDDDGQAYLFCGGGTEGLTDMNNTGQARRVKLNDDMISLNGNPETFNVPYLFEAMDIIKINNRYYLSYCTNWGTGGNSFGLANSQIAYMSSTNPMGTFSNPRPILTSASSQLQSGDTNNHQRIFEFKGNIYIAYHTQKAGQAMGLENGAGYRTTSIDKVTMTQGNMSPVTMTRKGVEQVGNLDPYLLNEAETIGIQGGIYTRPEADAGNGMVVTSIDTGDWLAVYGVDFGSAGATRFTARVRTPDTTGYVGAIELRLDPEGDGITANNGNLTGTNKAWIKNGEVIGRVQIKAKSGDEGKYGTVTIDLDKTVTGVHDLVFVFYSSLGVKPETVIPDTRHKNGFEFDQWQFF